MCTVPGFELTHPSSPAYQAHYVSLLRQAELVTEGEMGGGKRCQNTLPKQIVTSQWVSVSEVTTFITFGEVCQPYMYLAAVNAIYSRQTAL